MPESKIRWGILSTAGIGLKRVIPAIHEAGNSEAAAICSRDLARARDVAQKMNIPKAYGSYEELIADPTIDAIYNPLPNDMHAEWSIRCAEAGKPVLCEKPLAADADEAQRMVDAFESRNLTFAEAFMYRFHPQTVQVRQMVSEGAIGQLHSIVAAFSFIATGENNIRLSKARAGGALMDVGCYCVNVMRHMSGEEPEAVRAFAEFGEKSGVDERITALLRFPSGVFGHFDVSLRTEFANYYELRGTKGRILAEKAFIQHRPGPGMTSVIRCWFGDEYKELTFDESPQYTLMIEDFADALLNSRPPRYSGRDGVANMRVLDQILAAAKA